MMAKWLVFTFLGIAGFLSLLSIVTGENIYLIGAICALIPVSINSFIWQQSTGKAGKATYQNELDRLQEEQDELLGE